MALSLIAGLGNPGPAHVYSRHNIGYCVVDRLGQCLQASWKREARFEASVAKVSLGGNRLFLCKPLTFMNDSGRALGRVCCYYQVPVSQVVIILDDINLEPARLKVSLRGSAGGHNGLASIQEHLGEGFVRFRIGIGPKQPSEIDLRDYVLGRFGDEERNAIEQKMEDYLVGLKLLVDTGPVLAMNHLNRRNTINSNEPNSSQESI